MGTISFEDAAAKAAKRGAKLEFGYRHPDTGAICQPNVKQKLAHESVADVTGYGGAAGGGKSEWLSCDSAKDCLVYPRSKVALFRRTLGEIEEHLLGRFYELCGPLLDAKLVKYNGTKYRATFWNGSELLFRSCQYEKDVYRYQSLQLRSLNIDEASHFTEFQVRYLMTRVRKAQAAGRKRIRLAFNPGNVGHGWLKRWFIKPTPEMLGPRPMPSPFEVWRPLPPPDSRLDPMKVLTHQFIPALYRDNWALQLSDPNYLETNVYPLGGDRARQLAEGDWDANDSMIVGGLWSDSHQVTATDFELLAQGYRVGQVIPWHVCSDKTWLPSKSATIFGSVDYGYGAPWAFYLHAKTADGHTRTFHERYLTKQNDRMQAEKIKADVEFFASLGVAKPEWVVCDPTMWNSRMEMGKESIISVYAGVLSPIGVRLMKGTFGRGARLSRPNRWMDALAVSPDGLPWWSVTANCPNLIRTVPEVPWDDDDPEVENDESENHCIAEGSLVTTARGDVPIEQVVVGDEVWTREGWKPVTWAGKTGEREVVELTCGGRTLRLTPDHDVWTQNKGWIAADYLVSSDILLGCSTVRSYFPRPFRSGGVAATIAAVRTSCMSDMAGSIAMSFAMSWARFRQACTSIIETAIGPITLRETSPSFLPISTSRSTAVNLQSGNVWRAGRTWRWRKPFVSHVRPSGSATVYDLTVADCHEFVVNGILVSNSYESVGRFFEARPHAPRVAQRETYFDVPVAVRKEYIDLDKSRRIPIGAFVAQNLHGPR